MTDERAMEILQLMADGVDPVTGEVLGADHLCNSPEVIRALNAAIHILSMSSHRNCQQSSCSPQGLNAGRAWTNEDLCELERLYQAGLPMKELCQKLQRREKGILRQLNYLGLIKTEKKSSGDPVRGLKRAGLPWIREEDDRLQALYAEKRPISEIASEMQRSEYSIYCRMQRQGLYGAEYGYPEKEEPSQWTSHDNRTLRELYQSGQSISALAARFGRTESSIRARLFYMGLTRDFPLSLWRKP